MNNFFIIFFFGQTSFCPNEFCPNKFCPNEFGQTSVCPKDRLAIRLLSKGPFVQTSFAQTRFAQRTVCPNKFGQTSFAQKILGTSIHCPHVFTQFRPRLRKRRDGGRELAAADRARGRASKADTKKKRSYFFFACHIFG